MALILDAGDYIFRSGSVPITGYGYTIAGWRWGDDLTDQHTLISVSDIDSTGNHLSILLNGAQAGDPASAFSKGSSSRLAHSTTAYSVNTWHHVAGAFDQNDDRRVLLDGGGEATDTANDGTISFAALDRTCAGALLRSDGVQHNGPGRICECAIWNIAAFFTVKEAAMLKAGYSPLFIRPDFLVAYWPLIKDGKDIVGGFNLDTEAGTPTWGDHPRIIYPRRRVFQVPPAAVAAGTSVSAISNEGDVGVSIQGSIIA